MSGLYSLFREGEYPTMYEPRKTPVTADVLEVGLIFAIVILAFSLLIIIPGVRGKERIYYTIRVVIGCFVLGCTLLVNFGQEWEVAELHDVPTPYRAGLSEEIEANIKVKIGLRSINITLNTEGNVWSFLDGKVNETINYNERFSWDNLGWVQGRGGFGPFASRVNQEYREAQLKGLPYPILWIAEYFTIDGEWIRWGRFYRQAGFYAHIMTWLAFTLWALTMILLKLVLRYGGYFSVMTGLSLICANLIYAFVRNPLELVIPFGEEHKLEFHWGWCFWLCLFNGILTFLIGLVILIFDFKSPEHLAIFFDFDLTQDLEEYYADPAQLKSVLAERKRTFKFTKRFTQAKYSESDDVANGETKPSIEMDSHGVYSNPQAGNEKRHFRKRTIMKTMAPESKKQERPKPTPRRQPVAVDEDTEDYENASAAVAGRKPPEVRFQATNPAYDADENL